MTDDVNQTQPAPPRDDHGCQKGGKTVDWDQFHSHLQDGYRNAQETIRAMDTKVSILTGLSVFALTAVGGVMGTVMNCIVEHPAYFRAAVAAPAYLLRTACLLALSTVASLLLGMACIVSCVGTLRARNRISDLTDLPATILFPHLPSRGRLTTAQWLDTHQPAKQYYDRIASRVFTTEDLQKEYHDQILNVAAILGEKVVHFQRATHWFRYQMISTGTVLALLLMTLIGIGIAYRQATDNKAHPTSGVLICEAD